MTRPVVTRFAPSPTGYLHIGGARTTLFNWLYAKHTGGTFRLRIEDTDRERSTPAATQAIVSGLLWLGLDWDGEVVHQFARAARHAEVAHELLARGNAYYCYLSPAELEAMRKQAEAAKESVPIRSPWRDRDPSEAPPGIKPVIRLKAPRHGETVIEDRVQGRVVLQNELLDDFIILRSDGSPIYNLAVVVDGHDMGVTHVIRGVEHLTNAARQMLICQAMGWEVPVFAHVPLIHGADGAKLSKRHGALGVEEYQRMGYLPAALRNYLARLGWSHGDDEIFTTEQMIAWFDIDGLGKSPARFDFVKLADVNGHYIRATPDGELLGHLQACLAAIGTLGALTAEADPKAAPRPDLALLRQANAVRPDIASGGDLLAAFEAAGFDRLGAALPSLKTRAKTLADLAAGALYLLSRRPIVPDAKARSLLDGDARAAFAELAPRLGGLADWSAAAIEAEVRVFAEAKGWKLGKIAQPLRVALTGLSVSPPVFDVMAVLGREEALARLADQAGEQA